MTWYKIPQLYIPLLDELGHDVVLGAPSDHVPVGDTQLQAMYDLQLLHHFLDEREVGGGVADECIEELRFTGSHCKQS